MKVHLRLLSVVLTVVALFREAESQLTDEDSNYLVAKGAIDCGGHYAETCAACPQGHGDLWCNGACMWENDQCVEKSVFNILTKDIMDEFSSWYSMLPVISVTGVIMGIYAAIYKQKVVDKLSREHIKNRGHDFHDWSEREYGLFSGAKNLHTCLWSYFCTPVIIAKNYHVGRVMDFWPGCILMFVSLYSPFYCIGALIRTVMSSKLKQKLGYRPSFLKDCCVSLFCLPCDVGRESLECDDAIHVEIKCCFEVESTWSPIEAVEDGCFGGKRMCTTFKS